MARESRYTAAVKGMNPRQGIIPDYEIPTTGEDLYQGRDTQMLFVMELTGE